MVLNKNFEIFIVHIAALKATRTNKIVVYLLQAALIATL